MKKSTAALSAAILLCTLFLSAPLTAEDSSFSFGLGMGLGAVTFNETVNGQPAQVTYQFLNLYPDLAFGKWGMGFELPLHYRFIDNNGNSQFNIREADWIPQDGTNALELYLPKIRYIRYGQKGDELYAKFGTITDATLGNGFIMQNYSNALFMPDKRIFGLVFDVDGRLFDFPYAGIETVSGNLAAMDVLGARLYVRPLAGSSIPLLENLETGLVLAMDRNPSYHLTPDYISANSIETESVSAAGVDVKLPVLNNPLLSVVMFADAATEDFYSYGARLGSGGRIISILPWTLQLRFLGDNFVDTYFDTNYDIYRYEKYKIVKGLDATYPGVVGWLASTGFSLLEDKLSFIAVLDGPFNSNAPSPNPNDYMHLRAVFRIAEGLLPGIFLDASYDKQFINSFEDLKSPENAVIGARINYKTGPAVITFFYNLKYLPETADWQVTSGLQTSVSLF
jgi:hypothetical protein